MINRRLVGEIAEHVRAEARLERLLYALQQQKADLEILVATISEHSDVLDDDGCTARSAIPCADPMP